MKTTDDPGPFHTEPTETAVCDTGKYFYHVLPYRDIKCQFYDKMTLYVNLMTN